MFFSKHWEFTLTVTSHVTIQKTDYDKELLFKLNPIDRWYLGFPITSFNYNPDTKCGLKELESVYNSEKFFNLFNEADLKTLRETLINIENHTYYQTGQGFENIMKFKDEFEKYLEKNQTNLLYD
jgi:hypothetical protein